MANSYFQFKQFTIHQDRCAMKVTTDGCLFGAWVSERVGSSEFGVGSRESLEYNILDIGAGTGLLSMMITQKNKYSIDAIEIDKDAFEQASENISASPWSERIKVFNGDIRDFQFKNQYDIIISNPPFYENELKGADVKKNIAHHNEGLLLSELLRIIRLNLKYDGIFFLLLPFKRNDEIKKLLVDNYFAIQQLVFVKHSANHEYFRIMLSAKFITADQTGTTIDEIAIKDENGNYTRQFTSLLEQYYLNL